MVQIGYNSTAPNPQQLLAQNNSAPVVPETMQSTEPMMSVDPSMVKPDPVVAKKPTNQFDYAANIWAIPWVNTYSPAENPIFKTQIFKDSIAKQRAIPDAIKDFTSGMPKEEFANYYKEFKAEDAEWISKLSEDLKWGIPYSKIREFYPEIDEYGLKNLEKTIKSDEYLSDLRLDWETQLLSNEMKWLDPTIDYLWPIFEGNAKENLSEYWFWWIVIEWGKLIANIVPAAINSLLLFHINAITQPVNTVKMLGKLPKAAKLGFKQAWDDTEGMSDAERVQTMVSLWMDFITENPDIIFAPEAIFAKWGLASKWASLARRVVSNVGERWQKFINAAGNVQDTLKWEDKVIQWAKQWFEAAFEKEKKAPSNVSQETKDLLYTALPPRAKNLKYMTAVEYKESIPEALKSLFTNRDNLQVMPDPDTGAIKWLFQWDKIAKMNDTELVKNIVGAADTTLKDTWDIILEVGDQAAADGILGNTKDIVANIDNVLDNMQIGNTKILNTDTKTIRMLGEFRNQLLQNWGNIDIKTLQSLSQRLNKFWKEGDPMMIAAAEEINKLLRPLITDVGMQVLDNLNLSSIKKQWGWLRNLTDNFEALSKYAEKYPSPNVFQKANDLWSKIQAVKWAARILSWDPSWALDLWAAVMQNMGWAQLKWFDRIKWFAKWFRNMADHVWDTKIPWWYGRWYVKNLIKARINNTPKLGYTPEATPMITPEWTIKQTIVTAPEAKWWAMQTDITKPWAIKEPLGLDTREAFKKQFDISISNTPIEKFPDANKLRPAPNSELQKKTNEYTKENLNKTISNWFYLDVQENVAKKIADIYDSLPIDDSKNPKVIKSYTALVDEIDKQWDYATNELWIKFIPREWEWQPYANSTEMVNDVSKNKRLFFFTWWEPHPFLDKIDPKTWLSWNEKFRAIHDLFWHATEWFSFSAKWEENAWIKHAQMFSDEARPAMTTETRWQNSRVNYWKQNYDANWDYKNIPPSERPYATQKVALLPDKYSNIWKVVSEKVWYKDILKELNNEWWLSYDILKQGFVKNKPFVAVSPYVNRSKTLDTVIKWSDIKKYIQDNEDIIFREWHVLWIWKDEWKTYIDVTILLPKSKLKQAKAIGQALNQKAIYDLSPNIVDKKRTINTLWDGKDIWISDTDVDMIIQNILSNKKW